VLLERFDLAGLILFFGADADVCNFHDVPHRLIEK
jgi:hypothetical protein